MPAQQHPNNPIAHFTERGDQLMVSVSGVRGTIPEGLDPVNILHFARAFAAITGPKIVLGNDARPTGPILRHIVIGTLLAAGKEIIDIGLAPTPTVKAAVKSRKADGGIMLSASHNPPNWNAFKFIDKGGLFFSKERSAELLEAMADDLYQAVGYEKMGRLTTADAIGEHIAAVLKVLPDLEKIRKAKFHVVVDAVAGAGREALPLLLEELGCRVERLYCDADPKGNFPRPPEPTPQALKRFGSLVRKSGAAVGFALDPDADRLVTASPQLGAVNEEYTIPLALLAWCDHPTAARRLRRKPIVLNLSTADLLTAPLAEKLAATLIYSPVGEANVAALMESEGALFGGEGNGGVIHSGVPSFGRDPLVGAGLILSALASRGATSLDQLLDLLPELHMIKTKMARGSEPLEEIFARLAAALPTAIADRRDGLHLRRADGSWIHARASNTEPILRIIAHAPSRHSLNEILALCGVASK